MKIEIIKIGEPVSEEEYHKLIMLYKNSGKRELPSRLELDVWFEVTEEDKKN